MKDLILITSYHPDKQRENILRNLVNDLIKFSKDFDIMVISHTPIPLDIQNKINIALFDDKNELLTDHDLICKPWFQPTNRRIISGYLTGKNTHLALWRLFILGFATAKNLGYKKVHQLEYDASIKDINELKDNSRLLDDYKAVYYLEHEEKTDPIMFGSINSFKVEYIHPTLLNFDGEKIKNMIRNSLSKSPEGMKQDLIHEVGDFYVKDRKILDTEHNTFAISNSIESFNPWGVPFYDILKEEIQFVAWNTLKENGVNYQIITNNEKITTIKNLKLNSWSISSLGNIQDINHILILEDNQVRMKIDLSKEEQKTLFKKMSFQEEKKYS